MEPNLRLLPIKNAQGLSLKMADIGVSPTGCRMMCDKGILYALQADDLSVPAALILKQELLAIGGEAAVHEKIIVHQVEKSSVILLATIAQYRLLAQKLQQQQFGLPGLGQEILHLLAACHKSAHSIIGARKSLICGEKTLVMGIVNITPDSFYDGGCYLEPTAAIEHILAMAEAGVDIIDIGGASSRPGSSPLPAQVEMERILPVIEAVAPLVTQPISVDTDQAQVAEAALAAGADIINDISGLQDDAMLKLALHERAPVIIMHNSRGLEHGPDIMAEIIAFFRRTIAKAKAAGIKDEQIIIDPGLGFGKNTEQNLIILRDLSQLRGLGYPLLIGASNKRFVGDVLQLPLEQRLPGSTAVATIAACHGADIVRVHDFFSMMQAAKMTDAIRRGKK